MFFLGIFATAFFVIALLHMVTPRETGYEYHHHECTGVDSSGEGVEHPDVCGACDDDVCVFGPCPEDYEGGEEAQAERNAAVLRELAEAAPMDLRRQSGMTRQPEVEETRGGKVGYAGTTEPAEQELRRRVVESDGNKAYDGDTGMSKQD